MGKRLTLTGLIVALTASLLTWGAAPASATIVSSPWNCGSSGMGPGPIGGGLENAQRCTDLVNSGVPGEADAALWVYNWSASESRIYAGTPNPYFANTPISPLTFVYRLPSDDPAVKRYCVSSGQSLAADRPDDPYLHQNFAGGGWCTSPSSRNWTESGSVKVIPLYVYPSANGAVDDPGAPVASEVVPFPKLTASRTLTNYGELLRANVTGALAAGEAGLPEGTTTDWSFDWGDTTSGTGSGLPVTLDHTYGAAGPYTVQVAATVTLPPAGWEFSSGFRTAEFACTLTVDPLAPTKGATCTSITTDDVPTAPVPGEDGDEEENDCSGGFGFNIIKGLRCALEWAFVPDDLSGDDIAEAAESSLLGLPFTGLATLTASFNRIQDGADDALCHWGEDPGCIPSEQVGCKGPSMDVDVILPGQSQPVISFDGAPLQHCDEPMKSVAEWSRRLALLVLLLGAVAAVSKLITRTFFNLAPTTMGAGETAKEQQARQDSRRDRIAGGPG